MHNLHSEPRRNQDSAWEDFLADALRWVRPGQNARHNELTPGVLLLLLYRNPPLRAMAWFRLGCWFKARGVPLLPGAIQRRLLRHYGLEIQVGADIGGGLYIPHPVGVVMAPRRAGRDCSVIAAVTIGMRNEWSFPSLGDRVFIGAGARVLGGITIGNDAVIGANAVVISDVPDGARAVGIPARISSARAEQLAEA